MPLLDGSATGIDNENSVIKQITVNDEPAQYFSSEGIRILYSSLTKRYSYLKAPFSENELIKIAESLSINIEFPKYKRLWTHLFGAFFIIVIFSNI